MKQKEQNANVRICLMYFFRKRKTRKKFCLFFTLTEKNGIVSIGKVKKELRESKNTDGRACILTT